LVAWSLFLFGWFWLVALPAGNEIKLRDGFRFANLFFRKNREKSKNPWFYQGLRAKIICKTCKLSREICEESSNKRGAFGG
jgi:hypothetical protein